MPAPGQHPRSHGHRRVDRHIDAPERATHPTRIACDWGTAMDVPEHAEQEPEPISVARCRELLGDEADTLTDEEIELIRRHAETMAQVVVEMFAESYRIPR